jgi:signal transduction histidine kinase
VEREPVARVVEKQLDANGAGGGSSPDGPHTAIEDLLAVIAHELRAPLAVVCSAAETVSTRELTPGRLADLLQVIRRNADLAMLLTDRLALARDVERGIFHLDPTELDLAVVVGQTVADLGPSIAEHHTMTIIASDPAVVVADETALREILFNLLLNAVKYSPAGSIIGITVTDLGQWRVLTVDDHGAGVAEVDRERIFGKYQQLDRSAGGVGLGLFISRGLARASGGDLRVEHLPGAGSRFVLSLPAGAPSTAGRDPAGT